MDWKEYELYITTNLQRAFPGSSIVHDARLLEVVSRTERQIDILITEKVAGFEVRVLSRPKRYRRHSITLYSSTTPRS